MDKPIVFFRNDDVREALDDSLVRITELFIGHKVPISLAVEPANVSRTVADWLCDLKVKYSGLVEIIQHGYDHKQRAATVSGEFGGSRKYQDQYTDIEKGLILMNEYFGQQWFPAFTFPYGQYNYNTLLALEKLNYKVISTSYKLSAKRQVFNFAGKLLGKKILFGKPVVYLNERIPHMQLREVPVTINITKSVIDKDNSIQKSLNELISEYSALKRKLRVIGFLMHHRWWKEKDIETLKEFLIYLKNQNCIFAKLEDMNG